MDGLVSVESDESTADAFEGLEKEYWGMIIQDYPNTNNDKVKTRPNTRRLIASLLDIDASLDVVEILPYHGSANMRRKFLIGDVRDMIDVLQESAKWTSKHMSGR